MSSRVLEHDDLTRKVVARYRYTFWHVELPDLLQTAREGLCMADQAYKGADVKRFRAYAWKVIYHHMLRMWRVKRQGGRREQGRELERAEFWTDVRRILSDGEYDLVRKYFVVRMTEREIADELGVSRGCIRGRKKKILTKLKKFSHFVV